MHDDSAHTGIGHLRARFRGREPLIYRLHDGAEACERKVGDHELRTVRGQQRDFVARAQAPVLDQRAGQAPNAVAELRVGQRVRYADAASSAGRDQCHALRVTTLRLVPKRCKGAHVAGVGRSTPSHNDGT